MSLTVAASTQPLSAETVFDLLQRVRDKAPRVHAITNSVAQSFTANVLLAIGAIPSMTIAPDEVAGFVSGADALLINLGTLDETRRRAIPVAIEAARDAGRPVSVDPVFADRSAIRCAYAQDLLALKPDLVRLNEQEQAALFQDRGAVESLIRGGTVLAVTGEEDRIESLQEDFRLRNGHPLLARVTATGCAGGAVLAAFASVERDTALASAAGLSVFNIAGEMAASEARGPGTLVPELLDALYTMTSRDIELRLKSA
ncbi:MAG: hydroxyethylthiazole kinase [Roseibium sp.]|uniref:hydroxyethylthiazole kinase n=1 Tax=Roseibium sp. TaxID=1936156 RepID=UPI003D9C4485